MIEQALAAIVIVVLGIGIAAIVVELLIVVAERWPSQRDDK